MAIIEFSPGPPTRTISCGKFSGTLMLDTLPLPPPAYLPAPPPPTATTFSSHSSWARGEMVTVVLVPDSVKIKELSGVSSDPTKKLQLLSVMSLQSLIPVLQCSQAVSGPDSSLCRTQRPG